MIWGKNNLERNQNCYPVPTLIKYIRDQDADKTIGKGKSPARLWRGATEEALCRNR